MMMMVMMTFYFFTLFDFFFLSLHPFCTSLILLCPYILSFQQQLRKNQKFFCIKELIRQLRNIREEEICTVLEHLYVQENIPAL